MSETKRISPMLDNFDMGGSVSEHNGVCCYPAMKKGTDERFIVKSVSIPASQTQLDALLLAGAFPDPASALTYFKDVADRTVEELEVLQQLSQYEGFLPCDSWQVCPKENETGYDVYILSSYKRTLLKHFQKKPMTHLDAVNLGLDICSALAVCRRSGYLYADLKPSNIFVLDERQFRIGDLGFVPMASLAYATLPDRYLSEYTAPEVQDVFATLNATMDTYALGLILYQIYNDGKLPLADPSNGKFPPPENADYEMAEIILKACEPDPAARWEDPIQMGQALVSYMQRNGANDTPIIAPPITDVPPAGDPDEGGSSVEVVADEPEAEANDVPVTVDDGVVAEEAETQTLSAASADDAEQEPQMIPEAAAEDIPGEEVSYEEDNYGNLSFLEILPEDETAPENNISDVEYDEVSDEVSQMLAQADELAAHPVPDPVVAPEPIDVQLPEPEPSDDPEVSESAEEEPSLPADADTDSEEQNKTVVIPVSEQPEEQKAEEAAAAVALVDEKAEAAPYRKSTVLRWVLNGVLILLILAILAVGFFYYKNIYLLPIDNISVSGDESSMVVEVDSQIDEALLSVVCSDSHGNQISAPIIAGTATFANLSPDTAYNIQVLVDGFHRLTGETATSYSTPAQTKIVQFNAVTGTENGSVILGFTLEGPDNGDWTVSYNAEGETTKTVEMLSHMITLTGLTVGKEYTFTLIPGENTYVTGQTEIVFTASNLVYAQDVAIVSCEDNQLTVGWTAPEESNVSEWTVRCYDDGAYNQTLIISDTCAVFDSIDPSKSYTVEVTAAGMSVGQRAYMAENAITISNFQVKPSTNKLVLTWDASEDIPEDGWVLLYSVDDSTAQTSVSCMENTATITPIVPDATYHFSLQLTNGDAVLTAPLSYQTAAAQDFSGYGMIRSSMTYKLCKRPDDSDWSHSDLSDSDYTKTFAIGEGISIVGQLHDTYGISDDDIVIVYAFRNAEGAVVCYSYEETNWNDMWARSYGEFDVPQAPLEAGEYTLNIYFNGKLVSAKKATIEE